MVSRLLTQTMFFFGVFILVSFLFYTTWYWVDPVHGFGFPRQWLQALQNPELRYQEGDNLFNFLLAWASMSVFCWLPVFLLPGGAVWLAWGAVSNRNEFV